MIVVSLVLAGLVLAVAETLGMETITIGALLMGLGVLLLGPRNR